MSGQGGREERVQANSNQVTSLSERALGPQALGQEGPWPLGPEALGPRAPERAQANLNHHLSLSESVGLRLLVKMFVNSIHQYLLSCY